MNKQDKDNKGLDNKRIDKIASDIDLANSQKTLAYGLKAQHAMAAFSGDLLDQMRSVKTGDIEFPLQMLMENVRAVDISNLKIDDNYKRFARKARRALAGFSKADKQIFALEMQLDEVRGDLVRDVVRLGKLKQKSKKYAKVLQEYILAGEKVLGDLHVNKQKLTLEESSEINRLEKRVHDLKLSHMVNLQLLPQIDLIVNTNSTLIEKIQSALTNTIPLWRNQMVLTNALLKQKTAQNMQQMFITQANQVLGKNAQALKLAVKQGKNPLVVLQQNSKEIVNALAQVENAYAQSEDTINSALTEVSALKNKIVK